jgi:DNA primase large subunit
MSNVTLTLSIPKEMKKEMNTFKEVNWSEETRRFLNKKIQTLKITKQVTKAIEQNEYNKKAINELLQKLIKEGKLNLSDDFSDIYEHSMNSLKEIYKDEDDKEWIKIMKKNTYKKK